MIEVHFNYFIIFLLVRLQKASIQKVRRKPLRSSMDVDVDVDVDIDVDVDEISNSPLCQQSHYPHFAIRRTGGCYYKV